MSLTATLLRAKMVATNDQNNLLYHACYHGYKELVLSLIKSNIGRPYYNWNYGLVNACKAGNREIAELMIEKGANVWDFGLENACEGGHKELVDLMITHGANNWDWGMGKACLGGHRELVDLMIEYGAKHWNVGLYNACLSGHKDLVLLMIEYGATDWDLGLRDACVREHKDIATIMIEHGANINKCFICLEDSNIYYLTQKGWTSFPTNKAIQIGLTMTYINYQAVSDTFKETQRNLPVILDIIINNDLISEILSY